ncbi:HupE/UreJ family protein [Paenibacillus thermotolerans]|uniref:HupE/UreJ family protein n=1 Tax=Paenibacillus thermotolerans TaxID=3027807 RepID=UPI002368CD92|nr:MULTISPECIES: HupE/UreJ family protein [unclassified Paenibacillus]
MPQNRLIQNIRSFLIGMTAVFTLLAVSPPGVFAHAATFVVSDFSTPEPNIVRLVLRVDEKTIMEVAAEADRNGDGVIDADELKTGYESIIHPYLSKRITVSNNGEALSMVAVKQELPNPNVLRFEFDFPSEQPIEQLSIGYDAFFEVAPDHTNIAAFRIGEEQSFQHLFSGDNKVWTGRLGEAPLVAETVVQFVLLGIEHILTGYDHLLFLFALLLIRASFRQTIAIVTSFTVAHSITLALAALNIVSLPSRFVEAFIALSIVYVVIENVFRVKPIKYRWVLTFIFGLIHGFGFAGALREIGLPKSQEMYALVTFNVGVELGQLAVVCVVLPLLFAIGGRSWYSRMQLAASCLIGAFGLFWLVSRIAGV